MRKEAAALMNRDDVEQAEQLKLEALKLLPAAKQLEPTAKELGQPGSEKKTRHPKEQLQDLIAQERKLKETKAPESQLALVREKIAGTEKQLHALRTRNSAKAELPSDFQPQVEKLEAAARRIHHFRVAAENLKLAEAHDLARELMQKAEAMELDVRKAKEQLAEQMQKREDAAGPGQGPGQVQELRAEIERLRAEVNELRQNAQKR
jgi:hypothetical protein